MRKVVGSIIGCSLAWFVIGGVALAGGPKFRDRYLNKDYSFRLSGAQTGTATACPVSATGVLSFNGQGTVSDGTILYNDCSLACTGSLTNGTYAVNSDGTGQLTLLFDAGNTCGSITLGLNMTLFKNGKQGYLSGKSLSPISAVLGGEVSLQKNFP